MQVKFQESNQLSKKLRSISPCEIYYDTQTSALIVYALGADSGHVKRLKSAFSDYLDKAGAWGVYAGMTIYS